MTQRLDPSSDNDFQKVCLSSTMNNLQSIEYTMYNEMQLK